MFFGMLKSEVLLKQEEEFIKINDEIELQTKALLKEVSNLNEDLNKQSNTLFNNSVNEESKFKLSENATPVESPTTPSEQNINFGDYLKKLKNKDKEINKMLKDVMDTSGILEDRSAGKTFRSNRKATTSGRCATYSMSTTNLDHQATLFIAPAKQKSEVRIKSEKKFDSDLIPESVKEIGHEGIERFLAAKVKVLGEQVQVLQKERKKSLETIKELQAQKDKALEDKERLTQQVNSAKNVVVKCEQNTQSLVTQLQTTQSENANLKKELENLKKEMRQNKQNHSANELKLNRTLEELDKFKATIQQMKQDEKELKESSRRRIDDLTCSIKKAEKQRVELLNGFKKQLTIIDNLKRQKGLSEAAKLLKSAEDDFVNFLDSNPPT